MRRYKEVVICSEVDYSLRRKIDVIIAHERLIEINEIIHKHKEA